MKNLGLKMICDLQTKFTRSLNNEKGSQSVEFMGIAAVVIIIVVILVTFFKEGQGNTGIGGLLDGLITTVTGWFK